VKPAPPPVPVLPLDPTAERIKAIENVILELKAGGGSAGVIEQLQRDVDELKKKK
jgi:ClpP class serine protease